MNADIDISNVILETERLTLRPWRQEDLEDFFEYASVDGVGQMAGWLPHRNREDTQLVLSRFIEGKKTFALEYGGKTIGSLGVEKYDEEQFPQLAEKRCRSLGYVLSKDYWGRGLMPEAVGEVLRWLFDDICLDAVHCGHFSFNSRSRRVIEKSGFRHVLSGSFETNYGTVEDTEEYLLTREDWFLSSGRPVTVCGGRYHILRLLGHGKGGYSYLAEPEDGASSLVVLKQIHHEPCDYYSFGDKMEAELRDFERLKAAGIRIPAMLACDRRRERIVKEYIDGPTAFDIIKDGGSAEPYLDQLREMAGKAVASGLNIDFFPTNFVVSEGLIWYVDYECNDYMEEWDLEHWGLRYWSRTPEFEEYLRQYR